MSSDTGRVVRVVLDTNVIVSAVVFGGLPREILVSVVSEKIMAVTSPALSAELWDVLSREKFSASSFNLERLKNTIVENFVEVQPKRTVFILKDNSDNRVLEAAVEGNCECIITGDKELLELEKYRGIKIVTPADFVAFTKTKM